MQKSTSLPVFIPLLLASLALWGWVSWPASQPPTAPREGREAKGLPAKARRDQLFTLQAPWHSFKFGPELLGPDVPLAKRLILAETEISPQGDLAAKMAICAVGDSLTFPLRGGEIAVGQVNLVQPDADGWMRVGGGLKDGQAGSFFFAQRGSAFSGVVRLPAAGLAGLAYKFFSQTDGKALLQELPLSALECVGMKRVAPRTSVPEPEAAIGVGGTNTTPEIILGTNSVSVPQLESCPGAAAVFYLDFDGETVADPSWNEGFPIHAAPAVIGTAVITPAAITAVWQTVAEDYAPFHLNVTTKLSAYQAAAVGHRMRCVITSTDYWNPGLGGVAYLGSFASMDGSYSPTVPAWAFVSDYYTSRDIADAVAHELGHSLGLSHDQKWNPSYTAVQDEYFEGHGQWGPIMGFPQNRAVAQWSKCEYAQAGNTRDTNGEFYIEDDLQIMANSTNGFGLRPGDVPGINTSETLPNTGKFNVTGVIGDTPAIEGPDRDLYAFVTAGGPYQIKALPATRSPNLDISMQLLTDSGGPILTAEPTSGMAASLSGNLPAGRYLILLKGSGFGDPRSNGYSDYASIGAYTITGTYAAVPDAVPSITQEPVSTTVTLGQPVTFSVEAQSNIALTYQWFHETQFLPGSRSAKLTLAKTMPQDSGNYYCEVRNVVGAVQSRLVSLTLNFKPLITVQPVKTTVGAGSGLPLVMSVTAIGTPTLSYQWQKNLQNIPGEMSSTLVISHPQFSDGASYGCVVTNGFGSVASKAAVATVVSAPVITVEPPAVQGMPLGGTGSIAVTAVGSPTLTYQWYNGTSAVSGGTKPVLTLAKITAAVNGSYSCVVKNKINGTVQQATSQTCLVTAGVGPSIVTHPVATRTLNAGANLELAVSAVGEGISYQWLQNSTPLPGRTGATLLVNDVNWDSRGSYTCVVSNFYGRTTSRPAAVTVIAPPSILSQPRSVLAARNTKVTVSVVAVGSPTLKYQWRLDGNPIPKAVGASYVYVASATARLDCVVSNTVTSITATSDPATITVLDPPTAVLPATAVGPRNGTFTKTATVSGTGPLAYQWLKNKVPLASQTTDTLNLTPLQTTDAASYSLTVSNAIGTVTSKEMKLVLLDAPVITAEPISQTVLESGKVTFQVTATGSPSLIYQWKKQGEIIPNATKSTLVITSATANDAGLYSVKISNAVGEATSQPVWLTFIPVGLPNVTSISPAKANPGHFVRVFGSNLGWTTAVTSRSVAGVPLKTAFVVVSNTEIQLTVPVAISGNFSLEVTGRGGQATAPTPLEVGSLPYYDSFSFARVIPGTGGSQKGVLDNNYITEEGEPSHGYPDPNVTYAEDVKPDFSAWYQFSPAVSGTYQVSNKGTAFDCRLGIYTGTSVDQLTAVGGADDTGEELYSLTRFDAVAGTTYYMAVDGYNFFDQPSQQDVLEYGPFSIAVALLPPGKPFQKAAPASAATYQLTYTTSSEQGTTAGLFSENACFLQLALDTGVLSVADSNGELTPAGPLLLPGHSYEITVQVDRQTSTWGVLLNGAWISRGLAWNPASSVLAGQWQWPQGGNVTVITVDARD